ncbi:hypothetical protein BGZ74_011096 [Mortierella antarctica]|nr:hypothetical protein BGZ74_011096 [Mortierella antarctica]
MISSDASSFTITAFQQHRKRPSSTFSHSRNASDNTKSLYRENPGLSVVPTLKKKYARRRPWTNAEQESLYVAVERLKLFGRWSEVKVQMNLDRTTSEIEEEYTRLYGELPDTDDDWMEEDEEDEGEDSQSTPPLTASSSCAPSARSSQESISTLYAGSSTSTSTKAKHNRASSSIDISAFHIRDKRLGFDEDDEDPNHYKSTRSRQQSSFGSTFLPDPQVSTTSTNSSSSSDPSQVDTARPSASARMVRVWTMEQSENLKNLIEVYFPGSYRINWVWVAAQMGNAFTRKQCKNKWEIMRRRMGSDEEISLLKKGYSEFGPSWGQIQEKYLPERSRGGISIMWELLEARETDAKDGRTSSTSGMAHGPKHGRTGSTVSVTNGSRSSAPSGVKADYPRRQRTTTGDIDALELTAPVFSQPEKHSHHLSQDPGATTRAHHASESYDMGAHPDAWIDAGVTRETKGRYSSHHDTSTGEPYRARADQCPWTEQEVQHLQAASGFQATGMTVQQYYRPQSEHFVGHPREDMGMDVEQSYN